MFYNTSLRYLWYICDMILLLIPLVLVAVIWKNTPIFYDMFFIRKELSIVLICGLIAVIFYYISSTVYLIFWVIDITDTHGGDNHTVLIMIGFVFASMIITVIALVSTFWVLQYSGICTFICVFSYVFFD